MAKFILTSPGGNLGSRVLSSILTHKLIPASNIIITTSSKDRSRIPAAAKDAGIEIRTGVNFTRNPAEIAPSFQGGNVLFLSSYPSPSIERWQYHKNAIDAALLAGVTTVIYTSLMYGGETGLQSVAGVQQAHIMTIEYLEKARDKCGREGKEFDFIVIREGIYAQSWWLYAGYQPKELTRKSIEKKVEEGTGKWEWTIPNDGKIAWVGWGDLGEGTARIIAKYHDFLGKTLRLTGPRAISIARVAKIVGEETGVPISVNIVSKEIAKDWHTQRQSAGPGGEWVVESWAGWFEALKNGECAIVDPLLGDLIGRAPKGIEELREELFKLAE